MEEKLNPREVWERFRRQAWALKEHSLLDALWDFDPLDPEDAIFEAIEAEGLEDAFAEHLADKYPDKAVLDALNDAGLSFDSGYGYSCGD